MNIYERRLYASIRCGVRVFESYTKLAVFSLRSQIRTLNTFKWHFFLHMCIYLHETDGISRKSPSETHMKIAKWSIKFRLLHKYHIKDLISMWPQIIVSLSFFTIHSHGEYRINPNQNCFCEISIFKRNMIENTNFPKTKLISILFYFQVVELNDALAINSTAVQLDWHLHISSNEEYIEVGEPNSG